MIFEIRKRTLTFLKPAKTSRDTLQKRDVYYLLVKNKTNGEIGIGECAPIFGLSPGTFESLQEALVHVSKASSVDKISKDVLVKNPSVRFALETALLDLNNGGDRQIFPSTQIKKIPINGLVWMNDMDAMLREAMEKIQAGYRCIKIKIGGIHFQDELDILRELRNSYSPSEVEIRLDANGAFRFEEALYKLEKLSEYTIHSIEQPIKAGQWKEMAELVIKSPIPIALDEELIPIDIDKEKLLDTVAPKFIVLKPTLHGGFAGCDEWIKLAEQRHIGWWATSALESNIGLNAIAQWVNTYKNPLPQGLGTGKLYVNNIPSPIQVGSGYFWWDKTTDWQLETILL